ncbi:MAG: sulfatase-like hydrolase/transferase, partial [Thermoguttaceae bacterium]|nr:sulfatase-like hydrolase/transferase [Thermoguttaceae bacterium]
MVATVDSPVLILDNSARFNVRRARLIGLTGVLWVVFSAMVLAAETPRPNVVFFLADDLGWSDTGVYGSRFHETPNVDRLAARGTRFTNAYAANPLCSPTRASILTGQYPGRLRFTTPAGHLKEEVLDPIVPEKAAPGSKWVLPQTRTRLPLDYYTLAEALRDAGYATAHFGKWHLGWP